MKRVIVVLASVLTVGIASGDPTDLEGGVLIAHHPSGVQFSAGTDWCQKYDEEYALTSCENQNNRIDLNGLQGQTSVWYILAAWTEAKTWCGTEFGFGTYDPDIYGFVDWGACSPGENLEIPTESWPGPNEGVAVTTTDTPWSGDLEPVYYFAGYAYYEGLIPLAADPATGFGGTGNCATPPESWAAANFGGMGLFSAGTYVCPGSAEDGGGHEPGQGDDHAEDEGPGGGGSEENATIWYVCPDGSGHFLTIQAALDDAAVHDGDIVELCDWTFTGRGNRDIDFGGKRLTLRSRNGSPESCIIDCQSAEDIRGFVFDGDDDPGPTIAGITVRNCIGGDSVHG
ncbi:MAG: hypothetical protein GF330_08305 [Candidatus Eisenbacteria bacterium]|nr:hypothetical protein [Candidatus Eisenbacteria bacterium]